MNAPGTDARQDALGALSMAVLQAKTTEDMVREAGYDMPRRGMFDRRPDVENRLLDLADQVRVARGQWSLVGKGHQVTVTGEDGEEVATDQEYWEGQFAIRLVALREAALDAKIADAQARLDAQATAEGSDPRC